MAERLKNTLQFTDLAPGASVVLVHGLKTSEDHPKAPDLIALPADVAMTVIASSDVSITVRNDGDEELTDAVLVEWWHTIERAFDGAQNVDLPVKPFIIGGTGSGGGGSDSHFVYRPGATGADAPGGNVFTDWALLMAALGATSKLGIRSIEFDSRFAAVPVPGVAIIPPGTYNMTNTVWLSTGAENTAVALADGVLFTVDAPGPNGIVNIMQFRGPFLTIVGNRTAGPAPFTDINIEVSGPVVRFIQNPALGPAALPMFAVTPAAAAITLVFNTPRGGLGNFPNSLFVPPGPPLIDTGEDIVEIRAQGGMFANDIVTGTGGGFLSIATHTAAAWGDIVDEFAQPNFAGVLDAFGVGVQFVRYNVYTPPVEDVGPVTNAMSPYDATYNEMVLVEVSDGADIVINFPNANTQGVQAGERITVKMLNVPGEGEQINCVSTFGNTIEQPAITNGMGSKTWVMDGVGNWHLTAVV